MCQLAKSIKVVLDDFDGPEQRLAAVIIDPRPAFVAVGKAPETFTLDVNGNGEWEMVSGWFVNTFFCVFSHGANLLRAVCRFQVTTHGVFTYPDRFTFLEFPTRTSH